MDQDHSMSSMSNEHVKQITDSFFLQNNLWSRHHTLHAHYCVRQWGYSGFIYNEIWSIKFLTARAEFTWFSQGGNIGGQRFSIWSQEGAAVQWQCTVQAGGRVIFHIRTHTALHQGQLASFHCTINVWLQINHLYTSTRHPPTKDEFFLYSPGQSFI